MDQRQGARGYLSRKRRYAFSAIVLLVLLIALLYAIPKVRYWLSGEEERGVATGTINSLIGSFQHFFDSPDDKSQKAMTSLLKRPLNLRYQMVGDKISIMESFKIEKKMVGNAVFSIVTEGNWIFSTSFDSSEKTLFCEGSMKKGADTFTVFHCSRRKKR
ncbi:hypothetical protein KAH37_05285 [bacterium]|nr:hypothetical protein [bacterium]